MADSNTIKVVSFANLQSYDTLIKKYVGDADKVVDAKSVKNVAVVGDSIYFFKQDTIPVKEGTSEIDTSKASASVAIASSDVAQLKEDVKAINESLGSGFSKTNTVASAITAAQTAAESHADTKVKELADGAVATNTAAITAINNTETGILATAKAYTDALENGQVKTNKESIEAINDATTGILKTAKDYTDTEVGKVNTTIGTVTAGETVVSMIADAKKAGTDEATRAKGVEGELTSLTTDAKSTLVAAINEVDAHADAAQSDVDALETTVGDMTTVTTTAKTVSGAISELKSAVDKAQSAGEVYLDTAETPTEGYLKTYVVSQGKDAEGKKIEIGKIDIPKELVVTSGEVVKDPEGQPAGTYIKLTIANQEAPIYINVKDLVDIYTAAQGATQVQVAISDTNVVSATLVAGGVGTTELADGAVTTAKVADKNITKAKLDDAVQASLDKADAAAGDLKTKIESLDYTTQPGTGDDYVKSITEADGIIAPVYGTFNFDEKGAAATAEQNAKDYADGLYEVATTTDINGLFTDSQAQG